MKKLSQRQKRWNITKSRKRMTQLSKIKKRKNRRRYGTGSTNQSSNVQYTHVLLAPENLSILNDVDQTTLNFFDYAIKTIQKCKIHEGIYFDFKNIIEVTADAIMYVIALINNYKRITVLNIFVSGNLPQNTDARRFVEDIGFYSYVRGLKELHPHSKERFRISQGEMPEGELTGELCDFVLAETKEGTKLSTKRLYPMIIELMTNTCQHAYRSEKASRMKRNWYIFAERKEDRVHFVFLDTGVGIPTTVRYTLLERGKNIIKRNDAAYIASALRGENRTETKQSNRGKGLPGIYQDTKEGWIKDLSIISGRGKCDVLENGKIREQVLEYNFEGTMFSWNFKIA